VVGCCLLCPWSCQWPQKLCWLLGSIADFLSWTCRWHVADMSRVAT
jgi:hypothetical protein